MFRIKMQKSHKYTSLKLSCKVLLKCIELNPFCRCFWTVSNRYYGCCYLETIATVCRFLTLKVNQSVIRAKSFQNTFCKWSEM